MIMFGLVLLAIGIIFYITMMMDTDFERWVLPAFLCTCVGLGLTCVSVQDENISNTCTTQTTQQIQEQEDINNYIYCPTCGNKIKGE